MTLSNGATPSQQKDLFAVPMDGFAPIVLELKGIQAPRSLAQKKSKEPPKPNYHIPSFKNSKRWLTKLPNGKLLDPPMLITSPEFQRWKEKAVRSLESQLLSMCLTAGAGTPLVPSKLFAILSQLPADDSVNDLPEGTWKVVRVPPGEEGCKIEITRLS